ncbi:hypothetical protein VOLCADRAFT_106661 [Volvox carteri f. nagariensis]|uniref:ABC1 atypical kinase-like domain-containing protein n=1 Tax=Volvox carteri f. nagariensis TaxID=3068 RepID=D8U8Y6_VOLCA|nr:uncharacterized protein VOLCADRAFT_106661 [Volvox carteri f. nagariensis]EFJ43831.1 hypothetical protein VOLCADRAFT_106661 [Volvox carteri f. nagariensis]|eukprot:XP_002955077.1 hypothetical protein VOLCADRAFT_106661 [Volvox carteri f. nagariensis]
MRWDSACNFWTLVGLHFICDVLVQTDGVFKLMQAQQFKFSDVAGTIAAVQRLLRMSFIDVLPGQHTTPALKSFWQLMAATGFRSFHGHPVSNVPESPESIMHDLFEEFTENLIKYLDRRFPNSSFLLALGLFDPVEYPDEVDDWGEDAFEALRGYFTERLEEKKHMHDCHPQIDFEEAKLQLPVFKHEMWKLRPAAVKDREAFLKSYVEQQQLLSQLLGCEEVFGVGDEGYEGADAAEELMERVREMWKLALFCVQIKPTSVNRERVFSARTRLSAIRLNESLFVKLNTSGSFKKEDAVLKGAMAKYKSSTRMHLYTHIADKVENTLRDPRFNRMRSALLWTLQALDDPAYGSESRPVCDDTLYISEGLSVDFPVGIAVSATTSGRPDLRIELVRLRFGSTGIQTLIEKIMVNKYGSPKRSAGQCDGRRCPSPVAGDGGAWASAAAACRRNQHVGRRRCHRVDGGKTAATAATTIRQYASTAGALLLFSVLHSDAATAVASSLELPGLTVLAAELVAAAVQRLSLPLPKILTELDQAPMEPQLASLELDLPLSTDPCHNLSCHDRALKCGPLAAHSKRGDLGALGAVGFNPWFGQSAVLKVDFSPAGGGGGHAAAGGARPPQTPASNSLRRWLVGLMGGLGHVARPASALVERVLGTSALLSLAGRAWRAVHASSAALAEAVVDLTAVGLSYSCLARQAQLGRLPPGRAQELAWRRLHKAAAQRLARHLGDLPEQPPLQPALQALQRCSIAAGLAVDGVPLCGALDSLRGGGAVSGGGDVGGAGLWECGSCGYSRRRFLFSMSYSHGRRIRRRRAALRQATAVEATMTGLTAAPAAHSTAAPTDLRPQGVGGGLPIATAEAERVPGVPSRDLPARATVADPWVDCSAPSTLPMPQSPPLHQPRHVCPEIMPAVDRDQQAGRPKLPPAVSSLASMETTAAVQAEFCDGEVTPPSTASTPLELFPERPYPSSVPPTYGEVRRRTAPGRLAGSVSSMTAPPPRQPPNSAHATVGGGAQGSPELQHQVVVITGGSGNASPMSISTAACRGFPRLRAIAGSTPPQLEAAEPSPPLATSVMARVAAAAAAALGPQAAGREGSVTVTAAVVPVAAAASNGGTAPTPWPQPPPTDSGASATPDSSLPYDNSSSWGSGISCTTSANTSAAGAASGEAAGGGSSVGSTGIIRTAPRFVPHTGNGGAGNGGLGHANGADGAVRACGCSTAALPGVTPRTDCTDGESGAQSTSAGLPPAAFLVSWTNPSPSASGISQNNSQGACDVTQLRPDWQHHQHEQELQSRLRPWALSPSAGPGTAQPDARQPLGLEDCSISGGGGGGIGNTWKLPPLSRAQETRLLRREQEQAEAMGLLLYGRGDHAGTLRSHHHCHYHEQRPTGLWELLGLLCRAAYLIAVFAPFLTLGATLLLLSTMLGDGGRDNGGNVAAAARRPGSSLTVGCRRCAWRLLLGGCRLSGAAFIKWGQWSATRVDLFPDDFCEALSQLHDQAPRHSFAFTKRQVERAFGVPLDVMFEAFDQRPVASGSIAQVHRALMRRSDGSPLEVAVKVVHPKVELRIRQDFALLQPAAAALGRLPSLRSLSLPETVSQFSSTMTAQADLRVEAAHLRRFYFNFSRVAEQVTTPRPLPGLVRREVMVESWEVGASVAAFIRQPSPLNTAVVCLGVDTYLKMLLQDNFVHTDLHPGEWVGAGRQTGPSRAAGKDSRGRGANEAAAAPVMSDSLDAAASAAAAAAVAAARVQLVLLDFGLAEELTPVVRHHFISFLHHMLRGDGASAAGHLLRWTSRPQACPDPAAFVADMVALAAARCDVHSAAGIDMDAVMKSVLRLARKHSVTIDSCYASLVIAVCVIVGFATSLDPWVNLADAAVPAMLAHALTGRVMGRLYS